jgi:hypothetical protein
MIKNKLACFLSSGLSIFPNVAQHWEPRVAGAQAIIGSAICAICRTRVQKASEYEVTNFRLFRISCFRDSTSSKSSA